MGPEEALELMRTAPTRYESVRAAIRYRNGMTAPMENHPQDETHRHEATTPVGKAEAQLASEAYADDGPFEWRCKVWHIDQRRWRRELILPGGGTDIAASVGLEDARRLSAQPLGALGIWDHRIGGVRGSDDPVWLRAARDHFWTFYPLDPFGIASIPVLLMNTDIQVETGAEQAGRDAVRLVCFPREKWAEDPEPLRSRADEFELLVDAERGIILRCANKLGGKDFEALNIEEVFFDERFGENVFSSRQPLAWS